MEFEDKVILVLVVALLVAVVVFMYALQLGRSPEFFTEVFLQKYPENAKVGEKVEFEFVIGNYEGVDLNYKYKIKWEDSEKTGFAFVKNSGEKIIRDGVAFKNSGKKKVEIEVENEKERKAELWFWVYVTK